MKVGKTLDEMLEQEKPEVVASEKEQAALACFWVSLAELRKKADKTTEHATERELTKDGYNFSRGDHNSL